MAKNPPFFLRHTARTGAMMPSPTALKELQQRIYGADASTPNAATREAWDALAEQTAAARRGEL